MASNMHMKITGPDIKGESTDAGHVDEIELLSFSHGVSRSIGPRSTAGSGATGHSNHQDVSIAKWIDKSTPEIQKFLCGGQQFGEVTITIDKTNAQGTVIPYMKYILSNVIISSAQIGGGSGGDLATETVSLNYDKIKWEYTATNAADGAAAGAVPFTWDVSKNAVS
jgi:type VI secretion system secreted protein Hcp